MPTIAYHYMPLHSIAFYYTPLQYKIKIMELEYNRIDKFQRKMSA